MSRSCKECAHNNSDFIDEVCLDCYWPEFAEEPSNFEPKPITNADYIRTMSDGELVEWLWFKVGKCPPFDVCPSQCVPCEAKDCWLEWLKQKIDI